MRKISLQVKAAILISRAHILEVESRAEGKDSCARGGPGYSAKGKSKPPGKARYSQRGSIDKHSLNKGPYLREGHPNEVWGWGNSQHTMPGKTR